MTEKVSGLIREVTVTKEGETLRGCFDEERIAFFRDRGYKVAEVPKVVSLKPKTPRKGSQAEKTANGEQWWQK